MLKKKEQPLFRKRYDKEVRAKMMEAYGYKNPMEIPRLEKVVLNMGVGGAVSDKKKLQFAFEEMKVIAGQQPVVTKARVSVATFKLREGMSIGCKVTLRGARMYEFLERLVHVALPRVRDFRGLSSKSFDGRGNYAMGLKEQTVFPEVNYDKIDTIRGLDIVICTTSKTDAEAKTLLEGFNLVMSG